MRRPALLLAMLLALAGCAEQSTADPGTSVESTASTAERTTSKGPAGDDAPPPVVGDEGIPVTGAVEVVAVVDGDTLDVAVAGVEERVRLVGINAPERGECLADEAGQRLQDLVHGRAVELVADRSDRDRYGRLLRYVEVDGVDVGAELVRDGLALAHRYPPDTARADGYEALQREAVDAGVGMWSPAACGDAAPVGEVAIAELRFDADGDDNQNLDDEWVRITNAGTAEVDLTDWVLKDTSATHRYSFPTGFVLGAGASVTVRTGCGADTATDLHWCSEGSAVWNNSGDTAFLLDPAGNIVSSRDG